MPHAAYRVDDLEAAIEDEEVIPGPFEPAAFIHKDGAVIEVHEPGRLVRTGDAVDGPGPDARLV